MEKKLTLKKIIKLFLQLLNISLLGILIWLLTYGYFTVQPALELQAINDMQKVVIRLNHGSQAIENKEPISITKDAINQDTTEPHEALNNNLAASAAGTSNEQKPSLAENAQHNESNKLPQASLNNENTKEGFTQDNVVGATQPESDTEKQSPSKNETPHTENNNIEKSSIVGPNPQTSNPNLVKKTKIAILLTNLGLGKTVTEAALQLPKNIAFGLSPYTNSLKDNLYKAKENGHELFIELPFESYTYPLDDAGPLGILTMSDDGENLTRLQNILSSFANINGVYSLPNEKFTDNIQRMDPILDILSGNRLLLLYGKGYSNSAFMQMLNQKRIPNLFCDSYIDLTTEYTLIQQNLERLEEISKSKDKALGFINSYPITINALIDWLKTLDNKNIELVPISELLSN